MSPRGVERGSFRPIPMGSVRQRAQPNPERPAKPATPLGPRCNGDAAHPVAEARLQSHWFRAVVLPHVGSVRHFAVSREADPAHSSSRNPAGPFVGAAYLER
jgi:hypothetical protein